MDVNELYELFQQSGSVCTDSRKVVPGAIFFALRGDRFDGNRFAAAALNEGAAYAVVDDPSVVVPGQPFILVEDALVSLQHLARHHRRQFHIPVIGITGSNGKTTTKELVGSVLASHYVTHFTQGNLNNHIGVCLTLLAMGEDTEVAVVEMGANAQGEIAALCRIAEPTHGLITNIGKAHLEGFGGVEGVKKGKSELYRYLAERKGTAFVNQEESFLSELSSKVTKRIFYGLSETPSQENRPIEIKLLSTQPFLKVAFLDETGRIIEVQSRLIGRYNLGNLMTAIALGRYFKAPSQKIKAAIEGYVPQMNRSQIIPWNSNTILLDAYNANPTSMEGALRNFASMEGEQKVAILGAMFELGEEAPAEHARIGALAKELAIDQVILVGKEFEPFAMARKIPFYPDVRALRSWFQAQPWENTHFLIKGSRGMQLEKLLDAE
ncbi:MAG: UDP-N-acetylmuramoyl-tripeptide--D-alanyl-D-alanine ligase [Haliscomenobacter sp.]|nr:UDP-N-acetylmuramoyl-tripeptide--D-alanyl-D-alanine ligase [Haliscomenobacter sp.]